MSNYSRRQQNRDVIFNKNNHIKMSIRKTLDIMPIGFTNQDFVDTYKQCYSHFWRNILLYCHENKRNQLRRKRNKYKTVPCYSAVSYLLRLAKANICNYRNNHNKGKIMSEEERETLQKRLISHARNKEIAYGQKVSVHFSPRLPEK